MGGPAGAKLLLPLNPLLATLEGGLRAAAGDSKRCESLIAQSESLFAQCEGLIAPRQASISKQKSGPGNVRAAHDPS